MSIVRSGQKLPCYIGIQSSFSLSDRKNVLGNHMQRRIKMKPRMFAFDLDGTLLNSKKEFSSATLEALKDIADSGITIVFATGRIASSINRYIEKCPFPVAVLSLNGAAVYMDAHFNRKKIYDAPLPSEYADYLLSYDRKDGTALNFYMDEKLFAVQDTGTRYWLDFYYNQTGSTYYFLDSYTRVRGKSPSKIIFVGSPERLDADQRFFSNLWGKSVYICRTWDYYLEFLNPLANKGLGLQKLAESYHCLPEEVVSFGDAENDIPMLKMAGCSIAVKNATAEAKKAAIYVSPWSNDEDVVVREWELLKPLVV